MGKEKKNILIVVFLLSTIFLSGFLYKDSFNAYFFQDDWFTLRISNATNITDVFQFFVPREDVIYFRPLGMQMPFFILRSLFGVNPLPFHILIFLTQSVNIVLVFLLIWMMKRNAILSSISAFMYGVSAIHYILMFWAATYAFVLGPTFFFSSFILYILSEQKRKNVYYLLSVGIFFVGLLINEMVVILPAILFLYQLYLRKLEIKKLLPFFSIAFFIFLLRFFIFPPPVTGSYQVGLGKEIFINLRAYLLWSFNWPEEMKAQFVSLFKFNPQFVKEFTWYLGSFLTTFFISILLMFVIPVVLLISKAKWYFANLFIFSFSWFVIGLLPIIFFTKHSFSYYLPISLVGLLLFGVSTFGYLHEIIYKVSKPLAFILIFVLLANWTFSTFVTIDFNSKIHWAPRRAALSKVLVEEAKRKDPLPSKNMVNVRNLSENKLALNDQDAFKVIYNSDHIMTIYR